MGSVRRLPCAAASRPSTPLLVGSGRVSRRVKRLLVELLPEADQALPLVEVVQSHPHLREKLVLAGHMASADRVEALQALPAGVRAE